MRDMALECNRDEERVSVDVCVCVCECEREREQKSADSLFFKARKLPLYEIISMIF